MILSHTGQNKTHLSIANQSEKGKMQSCRAGQPSRRIKSHQRPPGAAAQENGMEAESMVCRSLALGCAAALCLWLGMAAPAAAAQTPALLAAAQQAAVQAPELSLPCRAAVLIDQGTGTVLYEKNASQRAPIASITKVMTLLLTFEAIHDGRLTLDTPVPVSEHAASMGGSQIWIEPGEHFTLDEMLRAICVSSANDAAVAVAELVGGSEEAFVAQMNAKAAQLGMEDTTFKNACGLDTEGHLSTARDVAVMSRAILNECPEVLHYSGIWTDTLRGGETMLVNTNKLLRRYEGITGLKTGTTGGAGVCISASASRDGLDLIAVVLGSSSSAERFEAATTLLDYGFSAYEAAPLPDLGGRPLYLDVTGSTVEDVPLDYTALPERLLVPKGGAGALTARVDLPAVSGAPLERGSQVGSVTILSGEQPVGSWPVRAAADAAVLDLAGAVRLMAETFL